MGSKSTTFMIAVLAGVMITAFRPYAQRYVPGL